MLAFAFDLGEEIAADAMGVEGEEKRFAQPIARVHGKSYKLCVSDFLFAMFIVMSFFRFVLEGCTAPNSLNRLSD